MRIRFPSAFLLALALPLPSGAREASLSSEGKRIHDYLLDDWSKRMHSTDIALAMENLGMPPDDDLRLEVGEYFRENTHLANNIKWWGANNYILSSEEKRIAKFVINTYESEKRLPGIDELSKRLGIDPERVNSRLGFMARAGLLESASDEAIGYALADKYARWGGPLRYNFHNVTVGEGKPFGVW